MDLISREEAREKGLKKFYTGVPCKNGHDCERYVGRSTCVQCASGRTHKYYQENKEVINDRSKEWSRNNLDKKRVYGKRSRDKDPEAYAARRKAWRLANPEKLAQRAANKSLEYREKHKADCKRRYRENEARYKEQSKIWYENNKEQSLQKQKEWVDNNRGKIREYSAAHRAAKLNQCPTWADRAPILEFYRNCPVGYHVDHIIPLRGKIVSGLHVIWNLQYLPAIENLRKKNKFDPDVYAHVYP